MKNKKYILSVIVIGISLVIGLVMVNAFSEKHKLHAQEANATITDNIFQSVKIVVPGESKRVLEEEDRLKNDSELTVTMGFKFTNKDYKKGDTFITTLPEGFTYTEVIQGNLSDTAEYTIDPVMNKLTISIIKDVQSAEYTINLTTRIKFDSTSNSKQQMLFNTQTPFTYTLYLYEEKGSLNNYAKTYDSEGNEATLMPKSAGDFEPINVNYMHYDLSQNTLKVSMPKAAMPSNWLGSPVQLKQDINSFKFYTYETTISGEPIGEKKELKIGEDFTTVMVSDDVVQFKFNTRFREALEVSGGKIDFDYSSFAPNSNGNSGSVTSYITFEIDAVKNGLRVGTLTTYFKVVELGYLTFGKIIADKNVKENERIVKTPIYINGTNQQLKKGDTFILTNTGDPALVAIDTKLAQEYNVTTNETGSIVEGIKKAINNWEVSSNDFGKITLTYTGADTTDAFGLDLYVGMDETVKSQYNSTFDLSGNGYEITGTPIFKGENNNTKKGSYNYDKSAITWNATVNSLYQKITKLTDTFQFGIKAGTLDNLQLTSVEFGENGATKVLVEGTDYEVVDTSNSFEIKFLKEIKQKLTISYETKADTTTVDTSFRAKNTITPKLQFASSDEKEFPTDGLAYLPDYLVLNTPYVLGKNKNNQVTETNGDQPVNQIKLLINPSGLELSNNQVVLNYESMDLSVLKEKFTVNKVSQFSISDYGSLTTGAEITKDNAEYPEITIEENQIRIKNKKLTQPIIVSFTLAKNNYYNITSDYARLIQTNDNTDKEVTNTGILYFANRLPCSFSIITSSKHTNIAESTLTIDKKNGSALIKGTEINIGTFLPTNEVQEKPSLRSVTDSSGNPLPGSVISVTSSDYTSRKIRINDDQLTNGLIVKLSWTFNTSGTKTYNNGGSVYYPFVDYKGSTYNQSYISSLWSGKFDIDNSGGSGDGALIFSNMTINLIDSINYKPVVGATYEILDKTGKVVDTLTSDSNGQILLKDYVVTDYVLKEIKAPEGYLSNQDYSDSGQSITLSSTEENKLTIPYVKEGKIVVHFSYQDGTDIETVKPITISGGNGSKINLKEQKEVQDQLTKLNGEAADYHFLSFDQGQMVGSEEAAVIPYDSTDVYYKYEGLLSLAVPKLLNFETGIVSPFEQILAYDNTEDFTVSIRDNRQITSSAATNVAKTRGNIRLNASLTKEFTTKDNKVLRDAQLIYQNANSNIVLNGSGGEIVSNKQDANDSAKRDFNFILNTAGNKNNGFKLEVPARGTLADEYIGEVTWEIVQEP